MAIDIGLLSYFRLLFPFLFVWVVVYAILQTKKPLGDNVGLNSIFALATALMFLFVPSALDVVSLMVPWFIVLMVFLVILIMTYMFLGIKESQVAHAMITDKNLLYWVFFIVLFITVAAFGKVFFAGNVIDSGNVDSTVIVSNLSQSQIYINSTDVGSTGENAFYATLFHPKVLGMIFIMIISVMTIRLLAGKPD